MITSVKIKDNTKTPFEYVSNIEAFENGKEFIFKPGVNVIIGKNGSGKSTLLNIISMYALCEKSMCSEMPTEALDFPPIFDDDDKVFDGIDIKQERAYNIDLCMTFERYIEIADKDAERAMAFLKEAYPFNEETEVFIRKRYNMSIGVDPEEN